MAVVLQRNCEMRQVIWCEVTYFESMHKLRVVFARSPPGTQAAGSLQIPSCSTQKDDQTESLNVNKKWYTLKPVRHQSTN